MASRATTAEKMEEQVSAERTEARLIAAEKAEARPEKAEARLSAGEKITFGIAAVFSTAILAVCVMLTIVGFIFSPITDTLVFALLMGATGTTSYVIWRGGKRNAS